MSTYTNFKCKIHLRSDTPEEVVSLIDKTVKGDIGVDKVIFHSSDVPDSSIDHIFFQCERWYFLFLSTNWGSTEGAKFYRSGNHWVLELDTEFKNYDDEIEKFVDWITPYVAGRKKKQYIGNYRVEYSDHPINLYIER